MYIEPDLLSKIIKSVKESAKYEKDYHNTRITELNKELISVKNSLDKLRSKLLEGIFTNEEYEEDKYKLTTRRDKVMLEIAEHNKGDDCFTEKMIDVLNLVANAHQYSVLSNAEGKRRLIKTVFSTIKLTGKKLNFMLHSPFDSFVNLSKIEEWLPGPDSNQRPNG
ncbi:recombinase RecB [Rickettsia conorii subsp. raoultii]|nr:recombinase RecB [Rickettsia conorii subsp. raoultii]